MTLDKALTAVVLIHEAQLELSDNPADHVPILELLVDLAKERENHVVAGEKFGKGTVADVEEAGYRRLGFEINLLRTKRKLAKK